MISRNPRLIVGFDVVSDKSSERIRNIVDNSPEADLQHYIPVLARKSRCFSRKIETLYAVVAVFIDNFNRFRLAKYKYRQRNKSGELPFSLVDFL